MFFLLSKLLGFLTTPSNAIAVICVLGAVLLLTRWRRAGSRLVLLGIGLLLVAGYSPLGNILMLTLSERFPAWQSDGRAPDGIIVLGGAIDPDTTIARHSVELDAAAERIVAMLELARQFPEARIVFSGGSANLMSEKVAEAPIAGRLLANFGIAPGRILLEDESRTTAENATFVRKLVTPKTGERWLLVTSAFHMPRSVGVFRSTGFDVEAYPVDWRTRGWIDAAAPFDRLGAGLARVDVAVHEWVGLLAYRLSGQTAELLPGPRP